jgi:beta-barrel assembly-enhancing protease
VKSLVALSSFLLTLSAAANTNDLPNMGSQADAVISLEDEFRLGQMAMRSLRESGQVVDDPEVTQYIDAIGHRLASLAQEGTKQYTFFVVKDPTINAFAVPGGFIGINSGLILESRTESELAGVLAHEITHVTQRHFARGRIDEANSGVISLAAMLAAILVGASSGRPDAAIAGLAAMQTLQLQQMMTFSRAQEIEADRIGMTLLESSGFDPNGMPDFFATLSRRYGADEAQLPAILRSHPVTADRISESKDRANQFLQQRGAVNSKNSISYELTRERLRVMGVASGENPLEFYKNSAQDGNRSAANKYGEAIALISVGKPQQALPILQELHKKDESIVQYQIALGQAYAASNDTQAAIATFERARRLFPRNVSVTVRYGEVLMNANQPKKAHEILLDLFNVIAPTPDQARQIAFAANAAGDVADAYSYMAEYHLMNGDLPTAINQLQLALAVPKLSDVQRARFRARLEQVRSVMPRRMPTSLNFDGSR